MKTYNIPGVTTSVSDYSSIKTNVTGGRSVLIVGPSKFGDDTTILELTDAEQAKYLTGGPNYTKYGPALNYVLTALTVTSKVYFKRITASDSRYANIIIKNDKDLSLVAIDNVNDTVTLASDNANLIGFFGKGKGDGYNEFYLKFEPAYDVEKIYADDEGDPRFKYNFLKVSIFQKTINGIVTILTPTIISLIDTDPRNNNLPILDITTSETLFVVDRINSKNKFLGCFLNDDVLVKLKDYLDIKDVIEEKGTPEMILKDLSTGVNYKVKADKDKNLYIEATQQEGVEKLILKYKDNDANNYKKIYVDNGKLTVDTDLTVNDGYDKLYAVGDRYFVQMWIDSETKELVVEEFETLRSTLYNKLIDNNIQLEKGSDGENFIINGKMNFAGPGTSASENVKMKYIQFINEDKTIREVMFPKYDFDYIVDWSSDLDVINAIINYTDDTGFTLGVSSFPLTYDFNVDYKNRTEKLYQSTFNNFLLTGQWNLAHFDEYLGRNIVMSPTLYAMIDHLKIDNEISITEPVAGIVKGQLPVSNVKLSYEVSSDEIEKLRNVQLNTIVNETDGIYFIDQLTLYKKASKLSRINIVKVIHRMRKDIPKLLKPYIQTKEIDNNIDTIVSTVSSYMNKWKVTGDNSNPDEIFSSIKINSFYVGDEYKLIVSIRVVPIGTIEKIEVPIIVEDK